MALSLGLFTGFVTGESPALLKPSPSAPPLFCIRLAAPLASKLQKARVLSVSASSEPATEAKKPPARGITKPRRVSPEMQAFLGGVSEIPRTQILKEIWAHIKQNNLQDPADKKVIICDDKLKTIFGGRDRIGFLEIAGLISPHIL